MKFTDRIRLTWRAFRRSSQMQFPSAYGISNSEFWQTFFGQRSHINYGAEIGDVRQSSLVMTAVGWFGRRFPEAPPAVYDVGDDGKPTENRGHELTQLLRQPNPYFAGARMAKAAGLSWIVNGNVYWREIRSSKDKVLQLWPIPYWMIEPRWNEQNPSEYIGWYEYKVNGRSQVVDVDEIIHFRDGEDPNNIRKGLSPLGALLREIYTDNEVGNFSAALMKNSGVPDFLLVPDAGAGMTAPSLTPDERRFLAEDFEARRTGINRGKTIVLPRGFRVEQLTFEPQKMDLGAIQRIPESRLASVIGIPASALGLHVGIENNTYSNAKELGEDATEGYLCPLWAYFAEELTAHFRMRGLLSDKQEVRYDLSQVRALQEDKTDQFTRNSVAVQGDWMKISEARADAGLPVEPEDKVYLSERKAAQQQVQAEMQMEALTQRQEQQPNPNNEQPNQNGDKEKDPIQEKRIRDLERVVTDWSPTLNQLTRMRRSWRKLGPKKDLYRVN